MCRVTANPEDLCWSCYQGGWCWRSLSPGPWLPVEESAHLLSEDDEYDFYADPNDIRYWTTASPYSLATRARARVTHTRVRDN